MYPVFLPTASARALTVPVPLEQPVEDLSFDHRIDEGVPVGVLCDLEDHLLVIVHLLDEGPDLLEPSPLASLEAVAAEDHGKEVRPVGPQEDRLLEAPRFD